jgi:hypothetical protein
MRTLTDADVAGHRLKRIAATNEPCPAIAMRRPKDR